MESVVNARSILNKTILAKAGKIHDFSYQPIEATGLLHNFNDKLVMTQFNDMYDTLIYSNLISKALAKNPEVKNIIDLGAGSSVPTLLAVNGTRRKDLKVTAIDIDAEAIAVSKKNADFLGLGAQYSFAHEDITSMVNSLTDGPKTLIVSNPPYIATPEELDHLYQFIPVNGGIKGSKYILDILSQDYKSGTNIALLWGSLTSPHDIVSIINEKFELTYSEAYKIHFGHYTTDQRLKSHLYKLRDQGEIFFDNDEKGETQIVIGTILKAI